MERSAKGQYSLEGKEWEGVSDLAKDLVRRLVVIIPIKDTRTSKTPNGIIRIRFPLRTLTVDPEQRITVAQALQHPWLMAVASVYPDTAVGHTGGQAVAADAPAAVETPPPPPVAPATPQVWRIVPIIPLIVFRSVSNPMICCTVGSHPQRAQRKASHHPSGQRAVESVESRQRPQNGENGRLIHQVPHCYHCHITEAALFNTTTSFHVVKSGSCRPCSRTASSRTRSA